MYSHRWRGLTTRFVVAVAVAFVAGCSSDEDETNGAPAPSPEAEASSTGEPELTVTAAELAAAFEQDAAAAGETYVDKVVRVTGILGTFPMTDVAGDTLIAFGEPGEYGDFNPILQVYLSASAAPQANELWHGQEMTVIGTCIVGVLGDPVLLDSRFDVIGDPIPVIEITAGELIAEVQADADAANDKYRDKVLVLSGVLAAWDREEQEVQIGAAAESGENPTRFKFTYGLVETELIAALENYNPGDAIRVKADCGRLSTDATPINLYYARILR